MKRAAITLLAVATVSCGELTRQGTASSYLIVDRLEAASGAEPERFGGDLHSDVLTIKDGASTIYADPGRVGFRLGLKDPGSPASPNAPTSNNVITVTRYHVRYIRADGRNTPGVDVPYPFDGAFTVSVSDTADAAFTIVRAQSKAEAPLAALRTNLLVISVIAEVTFFGRDQTGRDVQATARIGIHFANHGDPES
jgi:hypothetical protein